MTVTAVSSGEALHRTLDKSIIQFDNIKTHLYTIKQVWEKREMVDEKLKALSQFNPEHIARLPAEDGHSALRQLD